jgi:colanic acid biosynthesis glycosyl transferase WcaI
MKLVFLNRFFHPDHSATSQLLSDLAFLLAERQYHVEVISGRYGYDDSERVFRPSETIDRVIVHRVWTSRFGRDNLVGRAIDYATFYLAAAWRLWRLARSGDVVIAKTDPPLLSVVAAMVCRLRGVTLINWLQDIFPETAQRLDVGGVVARPAYGPLQQLRNFSLRVAHANVVLGDRMARYVGSLGLPSDRVSIIHNWADGRAVSPIAHHENPLRTEWGLNDAFVVAYSGNLGRAHEIDTLVGAMQLVAAGRDTASAGESPAVLWLIVGGGAALPRLKAEVAWRGLTSVRFKPYQPRAYLAQSLSAADVHLVSLRPELEGLIVPSKFYGIAAAGRATIFIGDKDGEIARLVARHRCGFTVGVGDSAKLAQMVLDLAADRVTCLEMEQNARRAFEAEFDKPNAVARWEKLILKVCRAE